ncbi:hypothetical protein D1818_10920 [Aquimarina sp. BL5]|uniref:thiopeptide-type bacteriocin biosynthesis protein n=1 Tax=Aquimarina sp. BL5 TaxID=1714860 RepID=UPI000E46AEEC|nr:thiopeptide-type bacteriocin biosynthesis protein [Aquimarina sp. BL5]AXT51317.1 hypothetical protein D1818_10920 [Aquimarina sp. BL5]RKM91117.1 hypothetical protein D7036_23600 [Aquimarina sp. BL5]
MNSDVTNQNRNVNIQRKFLINDGWLHFKIYCGVRIQDQVLKEIIDPLTKKLLTEDVIEKWYFTRYSDPYESIRLKLKLFKKEYHSKAFNLVMDSLERHTNYDTIWKVKLDSYERETEKYSQNDIHLVESFFYYDSTEVIRLLKYNDNDYDLFFSTLKYINYILNNFEFDIRDKLMFVKKNNKIFKRELNADKRTNKSLSLKYRKLRPKIESLLLTSDQEVFLNEDLNNHRFKAQQIIEKLVVKDKNNDLKVEKSKLLINFIHMSINRIFRSKQKFYELVIYDFLFRYYTSINAREI